MYKLTASSNKYKRQIGLFFILSILMFVTGCSSNVSYMTDILEFDTSFDATENITTVTWSRNIDNSDGLFDIEGFTVTFELYNQGVYLRTAEQIPYEIDVQHGQNLKLTYSFIANGEVDQIEMVSWTPTYADFWDTYFYWIMGCILALALLTIVAPLVIFIQDFDLSDLWYAISELGFWILIIFIGLNGIITWLTTQWIITILISATIIIGFLLLLLIFGIKEIIEVVDNFWLILLGIIILVCITIGFIFWDWKWMLVITGVVVVVSIALVLLINKYKDLSDTDSDEEYDLDDYSDLSVSELKDECRDRELSGYSKLRKEELIALLKNNDEENNLASNKSQDNKTIKTNKSDEPILKKNTQGITFNDIAGLVDAKEAVKEKIIMPVMHREIFKKYGKKAGGGILLYGLPGTGKTMFAEAVANEINAKFFSIKCSDIKSKWYGESEQRVKKIFEQARSAGRAVIFFDEFEAIGRKRTEDDSNGNNDLVPEILSQIQGLNSSKQDYLLLIIAATNRPWDIDSALLRPGRFDEKIYIPLPDFDARKRLFEIKLAKLPMEKDIKLDYLSEITEGFNGSDINEFCEKLKMELIKRTIDTKEETNITMLDVGRVRDKIKTSVQQSDIERIREFESILD